MRGYVLEWVALGSLVVALAGCGDAAKPEAGTETPATVDLGASSTDSEMPVPAADPTPVLPIPDDLPTTDSPAAPTVKPIPDEPTEPEPQ